MVATPRRPTAARRVPVSQPLTPSLRQAPVLEAASPTPPPVRAWVVDGDAAFRGALTCVLNHTRGVSCPATFASGDAALAALGERPHPDVLVVGTDGRPCTVEAARLKVRAPAVQVIVLCTDEDAEEMEAALCAGASACLPKHAAPSLLLAAIEEVRRGALLVPPAVRGRIQALLLSGAMPPGPARPDLREAFGLTEQEARVAWLLAERLTNAEVAEQLCLSPHTTRHHTERVLAKLGVSRRGEVAARLASAAE